MFQVASSVKPLLHSNIPTKDIPRNQRCLDACFFSSLGYCVLISRHRKALFQNGLISLFSEQNLAFKRPFCRCFGIAWKHSMDTTRHVFCSRSIRISFERVCFRLHPESSLRCLQTFSNPRTYQKTKDFWGPGLHRRNRPMALFCAFLKYFQWSLANRVMWNKRESMRDTRPLLTGRDPASDSPSAGAGDT